jgi:hypothetical protein
LPEVAVEDPRLVVHGLDRVGLGLENEVVLANGLLEIRPSRRGVGRVLGDGQEDVAVVEVDGRGIEPGLGLLDPGERGVVILGLVEADGDAEEEIAARVAAGDLLGERLE